MDYVKDDDLEFALQLQEHADGLDVHGATLGFSPLEITNAHQDADFFTATTIVQSNFQGSGEAFTKFKNLTRYGHATDVMPVTYPSATVYTLTPPTMVAANVEKRFRERAAKAKAHPLCTGTMEEDLRIIAPEDVFDPALGKPKFKIILDAGAPVLKWVKGRFQGVEIWVSRANGSPYVKLERDFKSPFVDHFPIAVSSSAHWTYKMIYVFEDETVGLWSDEVGVDVYGHV